MTVLTREIASQVLSYDAPTGAFTWKHCADKSFAWNKRFAGKPAGCVDPCNGYLKIGYAGKCYLAHRLAWLMVHGEWPQHHIDHLNGRRTDNRIANLRDVTQTVNCRNSKLRGSNQSGVPGVHFHRPLGKWCAQIKIDGRLRHLGYFEALSEASAARLAAQRGMGFGPNHGRAA